MHYPPPTLCFNRLIKKSKKKYQIITSFIFASVILLNLILQTMTVSIKTMQNEMLNNTKLSLILMQDYNENNQPYELDINQINKIENVRFANMVKPLALVGVNDSNDQMGFVTYAIDPQFAYYVGVENMEDGKIYCASDLYSNVDDYNILDINSDIKLVNHDFEPPMIFSDSCFMSINTYDELMKELPSAYTEFMVPEYIIGVDNVKNVYTVVKTLDGMHNDDTTMFMYQANGLEGLVGDTSNLLIILTSILIVFIIFNTIIISFLSSSLVSELSKDLMVLYLNGMSRRKIANELNRNCRSRFSRSIIIASILSVIVFLTIGKFILDLSIGWDLLLTLFVIDTTVIILNIQTVKIFIRKMVTKKTSNENISKILRN